MPDNVTYFALIRDGETIDTPSGLARRTYTARGRMDEALRADLTWKRDSVIYEWERGEEMGTDVVVISEGDAERIIEKFRKKWGVSE